MEAAARGLVDQCTMITLGQLAMFAFASLISNHGKLFRSIIITALAPLLCTQCLATWQWSPLRYSCHKCGFEVVYIVHQAFLWITMSLMRKLLSRTNLLVLFPDIIRLYISLPYVAVCVNCCACDMFIVPFYVLWNISVGFTQPLSCRA